MISVSQPFRGVRSQSRHGASQPSGTPGLAEPEAPPSSGDSKLPPSPAPFDEPPRVVRPLDPPKEAGYDPPLLAFDGWASPAPPRPELPADSLSHTATSGPHASNLRQLLGESSPNAPPHPSQSARVRFTAMAEYSRRPRAGLGGPRLARRRCPVRAETTRVRTRRLATSRRIRAHLR